MLALNFLQYVCHVKENIKYSYKKMWYIACLIRGMPIDEALKQLSFVRKKGAVAVKETLLEAQDLALKEHNVEFKSNLWVSESFVGKGITIRGLFIFAPQFRFDKKKFRLTTSCESPSRNGSLRLRPLFCNFGRRKAARTLLSALQAEDFRRNVERMVRINAKT